MAKLKLGPITNDKPIKVTMELSAALHRDLVAYAAALSREVNQPILDPDGGATSWEQRWVRRAIWSSLASTLSWPYSGAA